MSKGRIDNPTMERAIRAARDALYAKTPDGLAIILVVAEDVGESLAVHSASNMENLETRWGILALELGKIEEQQQADVEKNATKDPPS